MFVKNRLLIVDIKVLRVIVEELDCENKINLENEKLVSIWYKK